MRILHLATFLQGGAGRVITDLAIGQHRAGHEVVVVTSRTGCPGYEHYGAYIDALTAARVPLHLIDSLFTRDYAANLAVVEGLSRIHPARHEPEVIHAHAAIPTLIGMLWAGSRGLPVPVVQTMHGWGIGQRIQQISGGQLEVNQGSLYPALQRLEHRGLVTSGWQTTDSNRRARYYQLTAAGRRALGAEAESWRRFAASVEAILRTT